MRALPLCFARRAAAALLDVFTAPPRAAQPRRRLSAVLLLATAALLAVAAAACDPFNPNLGDDPFQCGENEACPDGYTCQPPTTEFPTGLCVSDDDSESGNGDSGDGDGDGDTSLCADSDFEPNDLVDDAVLTAVPEQQSQYVQTGLAICPPGDVDLYRFRVAQANENIWVEVTTDRSMGRLVAEITNEEGIALASGQYNASETQLTIELQNAATDVYFLRVRGATTDVDNSYDVDLQLLGP